MSFPRCSPGRRYLRAESPERILSLLRGRPGLVFVGREEASIRGQRGGAWARSLCARASSSGDSAARHGPVCPMFRNPRFPAALPEALAPPFLKSLILTVAKALRNTAHCWQLPGGLAEL